MSSVEELDAQNQKALMLQLQLDRMTFKHLGLEYMLQRR